VFLEHLTASFGATLEARCQIGGLNTQDQEFIQGNVKEVLQPLVTSYHCDYSSAS
jgi:hypothetical protein